MSREFLKRGEGKLEPEEKGRGKISKSDNSTVRKILYFPALSCI